MPRFGGALGGIMMTTMYKNGVPHEVNDHPDGIASLLKNGWTDKPPKKKEKEVKEDK